MKGLWSIICLEWRAAVRSRAVAILSTVSFLWALAVPHVLKSDGTEAGWFALRLRYSLGVVFALTVVALAATAAGSLAKDRSGKRLQLTLVRPVPHFFVALGRILSLSAVGALTLGIAAVVTAVRMLPSQERGEFGAMCHHVLEPRLESPRIAADRRLEEIREQQPDFVQKTGEAEMRAYLIQYVKSRYQTIPPGEVASWTFDAPGLSDEDAVSARIRPTEIFDRLEKSDVDLTFAGRTGKIENVNKTLVTVPLEPSGLPAETPADTLVLANHGTRGVSLSPYRDLQLLVRADSFCRNMFRVWLVLSALVAGVVSLAMFLGACLGRSVAVFSTLAILFVMSISPTLIAESPDPTTMKAIDRISLRLTAMTEKATRPLSAYAPIAQAENAECVEWSETGSALGWNVVVLPLVFSVLAGLVMARKQDGV